MEESDAKLHDGRLSVENAVRELQDEMTLIAEALDLVHAILTDLMGRVNPVDREDYSDELDRLNDIADTLRLHARHV